MGGMRCPILVAAWFGLAGLAACNPAYNWREIRTDGTDLVAWLPCQPDRGARVVPLAGRSVELQMTGCESGGATFAVARADVPGEQAAATLAQWRAVTLGNVQAADAAALAPFLPAGAMPLPGSVRASATGRRPDGGAALQVHAAWFARGTPAGVQVFQATIYVEGAKALPEGVADAFFAGLKFP